MRHQTKRLNMKQIKESQIESEFLVCPYCMDQKSHSDTSWRGCCSESSAHFGTAIQTYQGETYLKSEVSIIDDLKPISKGDTK